MFKHDLPKTNSLYINNELVTDFQVFIESVSVTEPKSRKAMSPTKGKTDL